MKAYQELSKKELLALREELEAAYEDVKGKGLKLDMSRGKPSAAQLNMAMDFMEALKSDSDMMTEAGMDVRNYGILDGISGSEETDG